jgi:hypothetical protein
VTLDSRNGGKVHRRYTAGVLILPKVDLPKEVEERVTILGRELLEVEKRRKEIRAELQQYCSKYHVKFRFSWRKKFSLSNYAKSQH